jgi:D-3-phosphoglycerate dehydrogenase / 2-oxoglutarate reductase
MQPQLLVLDDWEGRIEAASCWEQVKQEVEIRFLKTPVADLSVADGAPVEYLLAIRERTALTADVVERFPNLRLVLQTGGHAYHIDRAAMKRRGILVAVGRRATTPLVSVPELTVALMLSIMHRLPEAQQALPRGEWPLLLGRTLAGRRLGILGLGRHGARVARIAADAFQMHVVAWARADRGTDAATGIARVPLPELLATSDIVSIHLRLSPESTRLLNRDRLHLMKPGAILINTARGAIIDEPALVEALASGRLSAAGLDVFATEPLPSDSPLRSLGNVVLTPHIGWTVQEVFEEFAQIAGTQLMDYRAGHLSSTELLRLD